MTRDAAGERDSKELNSIATLLNLEYDDVAIGWWLPAEPGPILCASVADAVREALRLADNDCRRATAALSTAEREREALHQQLGSAIDVARETMTEITVGRIASIGSIGNTYCPQIRVSRIEQLHERLVALADSYRARVPSGGET